MKKILLVLLSLVLVLSIMVGCNKDKKDSKDEAPADKAPADKASEDEAPADEATEGENFKIGIVTGTVSQGEEEFRAAENMIAKYGEDKIVHVTYPDKFAQETETTISQIASLASDPEVKAIVITQAVTGSAAAIDRVKETRDDIIFVLGAPHEDPDTVIPRADMILELDQLTRGSRIIETAKEMGAETFIHYSFPRHMAMELLAARRDEMAKTAEKLGIAFYEVDAPDPTGDAGTPGAQQFIMEDVPRQVEKYGKNTAFFSTNCGMQEPLIKQALEYGAIYPEQCCPSPYHAYPGALGIEIPEEYAGDVAYVHEQNAAKVAEKDGTGRFATWVRPANPTMIEAGVEYGMLYGKGEVGKDDYAKMQEVFASLAGEEDVTFSNLDGNENFILFTMGSQIY
ncbi:MAG TPA: DUF3798 domain-containing protein [Clostridiaceae bacterium]|nr:DUF3798 domain-containing protein [Clostridiaceae bacterium]